MQEYVRELSREVVNSKDYEIENFTIIESETFSDDGHVIAKNTEIVINLKSSKNKKGGLIIGGATVLMGAIGYANDALGFISDVLPLLTG